MRNHALLLDMDGVINVDHSYVHRTQNFEFIDGIFEVASGAHASVYKILVFTNQSGIACVNCSEQQFHQLTAWMFNEFLNEDAPIKKVYFSPFYPTEGSDE